MESETISLFSLLKLHPPVVSHVHKVKAWQWAPSQSSQQSGQAPGTFLSPTSSFPRPPTSFMYASFKLHVCVGVCVRVVCVYICVCDSLVCMHNMNLTRELFIMKILGTRVDHTYTGNLFILVLIS